MVVPPLTCGVCGHPVTAENGLTIIGVGPMHKNGGECLANLKEDGVTNVLTYAVAQIETRVKAAATGDGSGDALTSAVTKAKALFQDYMGAWSEPRDPDRIDETLAEVGRIWRQHPDLRLTQLLLNVIPGTHSNTVYNTEDDALLENLKRVYP